jgi:hypothetical protein
VKGYRNQNISYTHLQQEIGTRSLAIILPGLGYSVQAPLLHFSTGIFLNKSFDVFHVKYQYNDGFYDGLSRKELTEAIQTDAKAAIDLAIEGRAYENFCLIGKSLGTTALSSELKRGLFSQAKVIWLTPLLQREDVFESMMNSENKGLCFIGENDSCYIEERFSQLSNHPALVSRLIPNANHSLEYDSNPVGSLDLLKEIMKEIENF